MRDASVGRVIRLVRQEQRLRQVDVAIAARVDQATVSRIEQGRLETTSLRTLRSVTAALGVDLVIEARWRGGAADRLVDRAHAAVVDHVVGRLVAHGWTVELEYAFSHFGDRGSVDVIGWRADARALLLVEAKSVLTNLQSMLSSESRKRRIVPDLLREERGWRAASYGSVIVAVGTSRNRSLIEAHERLFASAVPDRWDEVRSWIRRPVGPLRALWLVGPRTLGPAARPPPQRVRVVDR